MSTELGFVIKPRAGIPCVIFDDGSVYPATIVELALWDALIAAREGGDKDDERVAQLVAYVTPLGYDAALALVQAQTQMIEAQARVSQGLKPERLPAKIRADLIDFAARRIQEVWDDAGEVTAQVLAENIVPAQEFAWLSHQIPITWHREGETDER